MEYCVATKADKEELVAAIADLNAAIEAVKATDIADLEDKLQAAIESAKNALTEDLNAKVEELNAAIGGNKADLEAAVEALNKALTDANNAANVADGALKEELLNAIGAEISVVNDAIDALNKELTEKIEDLTVIVNKNNTDSISALENAKTDLESKIAAVEALLDSLKTEDGDVKLSEIVAALEKKIEDVSKTLGDANGALDEATMKINAWNEATDKVVEVYAAIEAVRKFYEDNPLYYAEQIAKVNALCDEAEIRLMRAPTLAMVDEVKAKFDSAIAGVKTKAQVINGILTSDGKYTVEDVVYNAEWEATLADVYARIYAETNAEVVNSLAAEKALYESFYQAFLEDKIGL
jgi:DNA repair exonuclease SbcCD ATPase subunit